MDFINLNNINQDKNINKKCQIPRMNLMIEA